VYLSGSFEVRSCIVEVSGRADGVWHLEDQVIVQEIKTSATPLSEINEDFSQAHWAQGKCYAYLIAVLEGLTKVTVRLTYYDKALDEQKSFDRTFSLERLQRFFTVLLHPYAAWAMSQAEWREIRNLSIKTLMFPYPSYRKGQKLLAFNTYKCIEDEKRLFVQAPTGTGKTIGVLYPAIKALGEGKLDRLFYATAKTTTRSIAENAYKMLTEQGLRLKVLTLTAKEKLCLNEIKNCTPEKCPFSVGWKSRSKKAVKELLKKNDFFPREKISEAGLRWGICPFELSLDLALSCDLIICDYNYIFDPRVYLRRFFQQKGRDEYLILVDEAHNLFDRARGMYSSEINVKELAVISKEIKKDLPETAGRIRDLKKALLALEKEPGNDFLEAAGVKYHASKEPPNVLKDPLENFIVSAENWLLSDREEKTYTDKLATLFFDLLHFKNILELFSSEYRTLTRGSKSSFELSLLCLDPGRMLAHNMDAARSTVLFSATLSPLGYYKNILGGRTDDVTLRLPSPFPRKNLLVFNEDRIETRFRYRSRFIESTANVIHDWVCSHKGNAMAFFPSYKYLMDTLEIFEEYEGDYEIFRQDREMDEPSRDAFLSRFDAYGDKTRIAFCVMGGVFGEGIDLTGDRLTSVIIVGVCLPQVSPELEVMKDYYQEKSTSGFSYAYTYPGINKVMQAAGRLIRTETDHGALLLIDSRFGKQEYLCLLPDEWNPIPRASQGLSASETAKQFWKSCQGDGVL
jgi:DNA excision repair protein ERCC-2